jgi:XisI protein
MDKITQYNNIIKELFVEIEKITPSSEGVDNQMIIDDDRGHYLLYSVGWEGQSWIYGSYVHIDIKKDGKVWLQHDGTSLQIADELNDRGIPKQDMVIGFQPPYVRKIMEGYAVT